MGKRIMKKKMCFVYSSTAPVLLFQHVPRSEVGLLGEQEVKIQKITNPKYPANHLSFFLFFFNLPQDKV